LALFLLKVVSALHALTPGCVELAIRDFIKTSISEFVVPFKTLRALVLECLVFGTERDFVHCFASTTVFLVHPKLRLTRLTFVLIGEGNQTIVLFSFMTSLSFCIQIKRIFAFLTRFPVFFEDSTPFDQHTLVVRCHFIRSETGFALVLGYMEFFAKQIGRVLQTGGRRRLVIIGNTLQTSVFGVVNLAVGNRTQTNPFGQSQSRMTGSASGRCFIDFAIVK
jgi:hypothetical protein